MPHSDYGIASRLLHRLALGIPYVTHASFDIERAITKTAPSRDGRHVFITGLARAGTTILLRALHDTGKFHSLTYRDMPFVLMPNLWQRLSRSSRTHREARERAHGDRIKVSFDSPEAFEEVFWRTFCADDYIKDDHLQPHLVDPEIIEYFIEFVALVLASGNARENRYLSKNNNNILRLPCIREAFPNAIIVIPFREPIQQANSLLRQHQLFSERHKRDRFSYSYMHWLAHHEFGLTHKPFRFTQRESLSASTYNPSNINYWVGLWSAAYSHILDVIPKGAILVCYEDLCAKPKESMNRILRLAGIELAADSIPTAFDRARPREVEGVDRSLAAKAHSIYEQMRDAQQQ